MRAKPPNLTSLTQRRQIRAPLALWPFIIVLALLPVWIVGILCRTSWTPDEPREADIAWHMSLQTNHAIPRLADTPFLEKPPLSYWMSAAGIRVFGDSPAAARMPNLLYAVISALAIGGLAFAMQGSRAAIVAALIAGTAITAFRVAIWLAPDACLVAGTTVALLGAYLGFQAPRGRAKSFGYMVMHLGAAMGFMAKSAPGWLVPLLALLALIVWERRWSELARWELYVGLLAQATAIVPWILAVSHTADGGSALLALLWHNTIGRFIKVAGPVALDYTTAHKNSPGKYLIQLPIYLLPWTLLAVAALRRAWERVGIPGEAGTPWRFAICAIAPFLALLSVSATARDIYIAPILPAFGLLIALWLSESGRGGQQLLSRSLDRLAIYGTHILVAFVAVSFAAALGLFAASGPLSNVVKYAVSGLLVLAVAGIALLQAIRMQRSGNALGGVMCSYAGYAAMLIVTGLAVFPEVDQWQDLPSLAYRIHEDARNRPLALLDPDETTIAMLDHRFQTPFQVIQTEYSSPEESVEGWLRSQGTRALVLVKMPGRTPGQMTRLIEHVHSMPDPDDGLAGLLASKGIATIVRRYELPEGRRYALLGH